EVFGISRPLTTAMSTRPTTPVNVSGATSPPVAAATMSATVASITFVPLPLPYPASLLADQTVSTVTGCSTPLVSRATVTGCSWPPTIMETAAPTDCPPNAFDQEATSTPPVRLAVQVSVTSVLSSFQVNSSSE